MTGPEYAAPFDAARMRDIAASLELFARWKWPEDRPERCAFSAQQLRDWADQLDAPAYPKLDLTPTAFRTPHSEYVRCGTCLRYCDPTTHKCKGDHPWADERNK